MKQLFEVIRRAGPLTFLPAVIVTVVIGTSQTSAQEKQTGKQAQQKNQAEIVAIEVWDYRNLDTGWSAEQIMDAKVTGAKGDEIGSIENLLIDEKGKVVAVIAEVGGFWDIGDTHVAVPWNKVELKNNEEIVLPVTEDNVEDYSLFAEEYFSRFDVGKITTVEDDVVTGPNIWKATSLLNDYALLENNEGYGYVDDLVFNDKGQLESIIVNVASRDFGYGFHSYPWYGYGYGGYAWNPGLDYYVIPYTEEELADL